MHVVEQQLISNHKQSIVDKPTGCKHMIENDRVQELKLMYKCFVREPSNLDAIVICMSSYIEGKGEGFV